MLISGIWRSADIDLSGLDQVDAVLSFPKPDASVLVKLTLLFNGAERASCELQGNYVAGKSHASGGVEDIPTLAVQHDGSQAIAKWQIDVSAPIEVGLQ